ALLYIYHTQHLTSCQHTVPRLTSTCFFFFLNDTATTEIYTLSLHDALPIFTSFGLSIPLALLRSKSARVAVASPLTDRKSTRLNSSHVRISYAVFCLNNVGRVDWRVDVDRLLRAVCAGDGGCALYLEDGADDFIARGFFERGKGKQQQTKHTKSERLH